MITYLKKMRGQHRNNKRVRDKEKAFIDLRNSAEKSVIQAGRERKYEKRALILPTNSAGQGFAWAGVLSKSGFPTDSLRVVSDNEEYFESTIKIPRLNIVKYEDRREFAIKLSNEYSYFFWESLRPLFSFANKKGIVTASNAVDDISLLKRAHKKVAVIFHGSDVRDVEHHKKLNSFSPFHDAGDALETVKKRSAELRAQLPRLNKMRIPLFVTTPDLFHEVPNAKWLPLTIECQKFGEVASNAPIFQHGGPPRVLFLPSNSWVKSAHLITPILQKLHDEGVISWVQTPRIPHDQLPELFKEVDVLIDQFIGIVGALPLEAMAAGRIVLTHLASWANEALPELPPVIDITPNTLEQELRELAKLSEKEITQRVNSGIEYVNRWHDGNESKKALLAIIYKESFFSRVFRKV